MNWAGPFSNTITGQITRLVLFLLVLAFVVNLTAVYIFFDAAVDRGRASPPPGAILTQMATLVRLADEQRTEQDLERFLVSAQRANFGVRRLTPAELGSTKRQSAGIDQIGRFDVGPARSLFEQIDPSRIVGGRGNEFVVRLRDGTALAVSIPARPRPMLPGFFVGPLANTLILIAVLLVGLSIYAVRTITSPLSSFAAIAHSVGRGTYRQNLKEEGPQEVVKVARALNEMQDRIHRMIDDRTNMLFAISHDLRTPLTRLRLRAEKLPSTQSKGLLVDIDRMAKMLAETLQYLRGDTLEEKVTPTDLASVLETICVEMSDLGKSIQYQGPNKYVFYCQPGAISRAVVNLVENAVKFGSQVIVRLTISEGGPTIDVSDDGVGIPFSFRKQVFEPFFKLDSARTSEINPGFGLGLSIARRIVQAHGGEIELLDNVPRGTIMRIVFPAVSDRSTRMKRSEA